MNHFVKVGLLFVLLFSLSEAQPLFTPYTAGNPVIPKGFAGTWDQHAVFWPIVSVVNDTFYLTYLGTDNHPTNPVNIGLATSTDGFSFAKSSSNPILEGDGTGFDAYQTDGGPLYFNNGTWELYYSGQSSPPSKVGTVIGKATASNPNGPWNRNNDTLLTVGSAGEWDSEFITPVALVENNSDLYLYYFGGDNWPFGSHKIGLAISSDGGITWFKYDDPTTTIAPYSESDPVLSPGPYSYDNISIWGCSVLKRDSLWEMFYAGENISNGPICYATSGDGIAWIKSNGNPIYEPSQDPLAITNLFEKPAVVLVDSFYYAYYDYGPQTNGIGMATALRSPGIINVPDDYPTIQAGINASVDGDTVLVADSTYFENINFNGKAITVASHFLIDNDSTHIDSTIINGSLPSNPDSGSVVYFISGEDTTSVLCGFTITGGIGTYNPFPVRFGGGIACFMSGAKIVHNYFENNSLIASNIMSLGSAINAGPPGNDSYIVIKHNIIRNNYVLGGHHSSGAIDVTCNAIIDNNKLLNNLTESNTGNCGEGIVCNSNGTSPKYAYVSDNIIMHNQAFSTANTADGGLTAGLAVVNHYGLVKNNIIRYNEVSAINRCYGPGMLLEYTTDTTLIILKNIIADNDYINGECWGGGISIYEGGAKITNNTIVNNNASYGGGIHLYNSSAFVENTIIWGNMASVGSGIHLNNSTVDVNYSDVQGGWTGTGNINTDPLFSDTLYHLGSGSPCIDAGHPSHSCNDSDLTRNDMGCYGGITDSLIYHITGLIQDPNKDLFPKDYTLSQNYPNPFNPTTTIEFSIPKTVFVTLKIYNILGQEVATLVSEKLINGSYKYTWDAGHLASGVYYYKLEAGGFIKTNKLILMK